MVTKEFEQELQRIKQEAMARVQQPNSEYVDKRVNTLEENQRRIDRTLQALTGALIRRQPQK